MTQPRASNRARRLGWVSLALAALLVAVFVGSRLTSDPKSARGAEPAQAPARLVSLAPAITETLLALDAGDQLVGVSQYCRADGLGEVPRVGTAITPQFEAIARLQPTLIVTSQVAGEQTGPLARIARTEQLPWLAVDEVIASVQALGPLVGRGPESAALAARMQQVLSVPADPRAPRVLLAMSYGDTGGPDAWFIRDNSLHGAVLRAAGGRNAVEREVTSQPRLSVEELLRVDPDQIILFVDADTVSEVEALARLEPLRKLTPLRAVQENKLGLVRMPALFSSGPRILDVVEPLEREIARLSARE